MTTRQDLRNRAPKFRSANRFAAYPKPRRGLRVTTVLKGIMGIAVICAAMYYTSAARVIKDCSRSGDVPRVCVD